MSEQKKKIRDVAYEKHRSNQQKYEQEKEMAKKAAKDKANRLDPDYNPLNDPDQKGALQPIKNIFKKNRPGE